MFRSAYHRISDDSVSSYGGHETVEAAIEAAKANYLDSDIDYVWVSSVEREVIYFHDKSDGLEGGSCSA